MLTLVRPGDTMTSIAERIGLLSQPPRRSFDQIRAEFDHLPDAEKQREEAAFSRRLASGAAAQTRFYSVLAEDFLLPAA